MNIDDDRLTYFDTDDTPTRSARVTLDGLDSYPNIMEFTSLEFTDILDLPLPTQIGGGRRRAATPDQLTPTRLRTTISASLRGQESTIIDNARVRRAQMTSIEETHPTGMADDDDSKSRYPTPYLGAQPSFDGPALDVSTRPTRVYGNRRASPQNTDFGGRYPSPSPVSDNQHHVGPSYQPVARHPSDFNYQHRQFADSRSTTRSSVDTQYTHDHRPPSSHTQDLDYSRLQPPSRPTLQQYENRPDEERHDNYACEFPLLTFVLELSANSQTSSFQTSSTICTPSRPSATIHAASRPSLTICTTSRPSTTLCPA
jgi:hypothetical protein